jgi:hypothetical protein
MRTPKPTTFRGYGAAVQAVTAALIIARLLDIHAVTAPVSLFLCALMFSAWYGGVGPGLLVMVLSLLAFDYYFLTPISSLTLESYEIPRLLIFALASVFVVSLSAAQRSAAESLRRGRDEQIRAEGTKFPRQAVSHVEGHGQCGRRHSHAKRQRRRRDYFPARLSREGIADDSKKHNFFHAGNFVRHHKMLARADGKPRL